MNKTKKLTLLALVVAMFMAFSSAIAMMMPSNKTYATDTAVVTTEADLNAALAAGGEVALGNDIVVRTMIEVSKDVTATLDLAGYKITSGYQDGSTTKHIYPLDVYGNLTVKDSSVDGSITGRGIYIRDGGKFTLNSGAVYGIDSNGGSALYQFGGDIVINGGLVEQKAEGTSNFAINAAGGTVTVYGGKITGNHGAIAAVGAIVVINDGEFICTGTDGMTDNVLYSSGSGSITIHGGTFVGDGDGPSGGCCVYDSNGAITVNGGNFSNSSGGDVWGTTGTAINGGSFENLIETSRVTVGATIVNGGKVYTKTENGVEEIENCTVISTADELKAFADAVNAGDSYEGKLVVLANDIDLQYTAVIIGTKANPFKGTFDGQGFIVKNLTIYEDGSESDYFADSDDCLGLFGVINTPAVVKNVTVDNPFIVGSSYVGGIVGMAYTGKIENCHVTGEIDIEGYYMVGGITGHGYAKIYDCSVIGEEGWDYSYVGATYKEANLEGDNVGGIVGHNAENNDIHNCTVKNVTVSGTRKVGGIVGITNMATRISGCKVDDVIVETTATEDYANDNVKTMSIGGIVGQYQNSGSAGVVSNCSVSGLTFVNENNVVVSAGAVTGGMRGTTKILAPTGIAYSSNTTAEVEGANSAYHKPAPTSTLTNCYTSSTGYWGECGGNASESFVFKFYNGDTYMGYTSLNNVGGIIDGDVNVSWSILLDAASNTDEYWTMAWDIQPTIAMQPTRVEHWVDGVKCAEATVEPNWPDRIFPVVAAVTDADGKILSFVNGTSGNTLKDAFNNGGNIVLLRDIALTDSINIPAGVTVMLDLNGKTISQTKAQTAGYQMILNDGELTIKDSVGAGKISYTDSGNGGEYISDVIYNRATLVINGGTIENLSSATVATNGYPHAVDTYSGIRDTSVTINGGTIYCAEYSAIRMFCVSATYKADLVINEGATIKGAIDMQNGTKNSALGSLTINGGTFETTKNANNIRFANWNGGATEYGISASIEGGSFNGGITTQYVPAAANWNKQIISGGTFTNDLSDFCAEGFELVANENGTYGVVEIKVAEVNGVQYTSLEDAIAAVKAGETITLLNDATLSAETTIPAGVTINGNGKTINGSIVAGGDITFVGHTKVTSFNAGYSKPVVTIGVGACLELIGTGRMVIGHGATFNIIGSIVDAKTANIADLTPSLIMPGASFTGAGVTFNVTNAYIKTTASYCSSSKSASGTFDFNINNSIWEQFGKLAFEAQSTAATVNFELKDSELTTTSHLVFGVSKGEIVIDNSNVNVGTSRQIENQSTMTVKNGSVVNGLVATSSNAKNPGTLIVDNATYAVTGEFSGSDLGTGTLIVKNGASFSAGSITKANIQIDATGMAAGEVNMITANLSKLAGTLEVINNSALKADIVDGKIVLVERTLLGAGTAEDPYLINNIDDLKFFRDSVNNGTRYNGQFVKLNANIDLNDEEWTPIGDRNVDQGSFLGTFDGGDHIISNLWISEWTKTGAGFFSKVGMQTEYVSGTVKNVTFNNVTIISNESYVGVIAQAPSGALIENVHITGDVTIQGYGYVGGIVGHGYPTINNCSVIANEDSQIIAHYWGAGAILGFAGDYGAKISGATVKGVEIFADLGGAASVAGSPYGAAITGEITVKDVTITSNSDYCMSYIAGGGNINTKDITMENVTATANGNPITPGDAVASVNGVMYFSLAEAIGAVQANETIILLNDITFAENASSIVIDKPITIKGEGKKLTFNSATSAFVIKSSNVMFSNMTIKQGTKDNSFHISIDKGAWNAPAIQYKGIIIENIDFVGGDYALCLIGEDVIVNSCTFTNQDSHNIIIYSVKGETKITNNVFNASKGNNKSAILYEGGAPEKGFGTVDALAKFMGGGDLIISGNEANAKGVFFQFTNWGLIEDMKVAITKNKIDAFTNKAIAIYDMNGAIKPAGNEFSSIVVNKNVFTNVPSGRPILKEYTGVFDVEVYENYLGSANPDYEALLVGNKVNVKSYYSDETLTSLVKVGLDGEGTEANPFLINSVEEFILFRDSVNAGETKYNAEGIWVELNADIDLGGAVWTKGIGDGHNWSFDANFDGKNHTIKNLVINPYADESGYVCGGLFGYVYGNVTIKNLVIENVDISTVDAGHNVGILVGFAYKANLTIENVTIKGNVKVDAANVNGVGGMLGYAYETTLTATDCVVDANDGSYIKGYSFVGGIVGYSYDNATISACEVENINIIATSMYGGGVAGLVLADNTIDSCTVVNVEVSGQVIGSVVGALASGVVTVSNCTANGPMVGGVYDDTKAVLAAKVGNKYYTDLHEAMVACKAGETVLLLNDVDLAGITWEPVSFAGTFDGQNHVIKNLTINKPGVSNTGFITSLNGTFKNVTFTNPTVTGGENTGVVAGRTGGSAALAENIIINGTIKVETTHKGYARLGAIVGGWAYGNYENITVDGSDKAVSYLKHTGGGDGRYVGGIVGHADDVESYVNCTVKNITISGGWLCGGICGPGPASATISGCAVENLDMGADYSGGMFGWYFGNGTIKDSSVKDVTFTAGSSNNGAIGGYSNNTDAIISNVTIENVANANGAPLLNHVAKVGNVGYATLEEAFAAATETDTIVLLKDATPTLKSQRAITKASVIDLNGKTLTLTEDDLYFGTTTFKNGTIVVDPSVKPSTAVFWMFKDQTLTFDAVTLVATGVTGTYLIGLDGNNSDLNVINGSEIVVNNQTALDLDIICVNATTGNDILVKDSKVNVTNLDGRVFFRGNYTINGSSEIVLNGITKAGFRIEAGQTLSIEDTASVEIIGEPRDGGIHLTDVTATYTKADTATVNATINKPVASVNGKSYATLEESFKAATSGCTIYILTDVTISGAWDCRNNGAKFTVPVTIDGNGKTITFTGDIKDNNWNTIFRFEADATVKNLIIDASNATGVQRAISAKANLMVDTCYFIGNGTSAKYAVIFGEGAGAAISDVTANITNSAFKNWSYGVADNQNAQDAKSVIITDCDFANAKVNVSASESVTFTGNTLVGGYASISSYTNYAGVKVTATGNILDSAFAEYNTINAKADNVNAEGFMLPVAEINGKAYFTLAKAVEKASAGATIKLISDITLTETVKVFADDKLTIDLNGYTVDGTGNVRIAIMSYGDLTIVDFSAEKDGTIKAGIGTAGNAINICAGTFTLESGNIYSLNNAILVDEQTATVNIKGGKITAEPNTRNSAVFYVSSTSKTVINITGGELVGYNGILLWNNTTVNMSAGSIEAKGSAGIQGNGTCDNTEINISGDAVISGYYTAIYHPQGGKLNISENATLTGWTGVVVKGGIVNVSGGTINGTGAADAYRPVSSGFVDTGDALYVEHYDNSTNSENYGTPVVTVTGGTFNSTNAAAVASYVNSNNAIEALSAFISGGTFNTALSEELCAYGYVLTENADGTYGVNKWDGVTINNLEQLIMFRDNVNAGDTYKGKTVVLNADVDLTGINWIPIGTKANAFQGTFDGQRNTISNLYINDTDLSHAGLFGYAQNAKINNVNVVNVDINAYSQVGAIAGTVYTGSVENCHVSGTIKLIAQYAYAGGITSEGYVTVKDCSVIADDMGEITVVEKSMAGGITGWRGEGKNDIRNCTVKNLKITAYASIGAITGLVHYENTIDNCTVENVELYKTREDGQASIGLAAGNWSNKADDNYTITITNNTFNKVSINGTAITSLNQLCGSNYSYYDKVIKLVDNNTNTYEDITIDFSIVVKSADNFEKSVAYVKEGDTINLGADITLNKDVTISKIINLNGFTLTVADGCVANVDGATFVGDGNINATLELSAGESFTAKEGLNVITADGYSVEYNNGVYTSVKNVASVNGKSYATLEEAFKAATSGATITILDDVTIDYYWDCRYTGSKFTVPVTINGNGKTLKFTNTVYDGGNHYTVFRFEADATVENLTIDMSEARSGFNGRFRAISAKADLTVDNCTFIGNGSTNNTRAIIYGESAGSAISSVEISITNSTFNGWRRGVSDNENAQDAKTVTVTGNTFVDASAYISASENVTFTGNTLDSGWVNITSYAKASELTVNATGNTLEDNDNTNFNIITNAVTVNADEGFMIPVAEVNGKAYFTLQSAVDKANAGDVVKLLSNATAVTVSEGKTITIDLNGNDIVGETFGITNNGTLTINDTVGTGKVYTTDVSAQGRPAILNNVTGVITINAGWFGDSNNDTTDRNAINRGNAIKNYGEATINGGYFTNVSNQYIDANAYAYAINTLAGATTIINNATVYGDINGLIFSDGKTIVNDGSFTLGRPNEENNLWYLAYGDVEIKGGTWNRAFKVPSWNTDDPKFYGDVVVSNGTFNVSVPKQYLAEGRVIAKKEGLFAVGVMPNAEVANLGAITVTNGTGANQFEDSYYIYDLVGSQKLTSATAPFALQVAMKFTANDTLEQAQANVFSNYTTDFFIQINGIENGSFVANGCYIAGYYPSFDAWVVIPLDGFTIEDGKVYPVITSAGFDFKYTDICDAVGEFTCGIYLTPEVLAANPNLTVGLDLGLSETKDEALSAQFNKVDGYKYEAEELATAFAAKIGDMHYTTFAEAYNAAKAGETVTLIRDVELANTLKVVAGKDITLDLNGKVISGTCNAGQTTLIHINNGAKLTVKDSSTAQTGKITFAKGTSNVGWTIYLEGKLDLASGIIELTGDNWNIGYAVDVRPNAWGAGYTEPTVFTMNGGKIVSSDGAVRVASSSADGYTNISASFVMNGGAIEAAWDGVFVQQSNAIYDVLNFTMNGGSIASALNPIRVYGGEPTGYVNGEDCINITLNGGALEYTGTEQRTWLIENVLRVGGGMAAETLLANGDVTVSETVKANLTLAEGYEFVNNSDGTYKVQEIARASVAYRAYINDSASREAIQIDLANVLTRESLVIELYDANGNLLTTTSLKAGASKANALTANVVLWGSASGSWDTVINAEKLTVANAPAVIKLYADGVLVDTYENAFGAGTNVDETAKYLALDCVYKEAMIGETYYATLAEAFNAANAGETITLIEDITLTESITVADDKVVTLDINGKVVSMADASNAGCYMIKNYGSLTIIDSVGTGKLTFNSTTPSANFSYSTSTIGNAGNLVVESGIIENTTVGGASYAIDTIWYNKDVSITINGGTITANKIAVRQVPFSTTYKNVVTVNGGTLTGATAGLQTFNTSSPANLAEVNIKGGTFNGTYAFYTSYTSANGSAGTTINISDGVFNGYVYLYNGIAGGSAMNITVTDGQFNGGYYAYTYDVNGNEVGIPSVQGGTFAQDVTNYCANGFVCVKNENGTYGVHEAAAIVAVVYDGDANTIATIEGTDFTKVLEKVDALTNVGSVIITLYGDVTTAETINVKYTTYIHGEGHTITYTGTNRAINVSKEAGKINLMIDHLSVVAEKAERGINYNTTGKLDLNNVSVTAGTYAINFPSSANDAHIDIDHSTLTANVALNVWGKNMVITVNESVLTNVDNTAVENYSVIQLNNNGSVIADGTKVTVTGGKVIATGDSYATSNWTATGTISISNTTEVVGEQVTMIAWVDGYGIISLQGAFDYAARVGKAVTVTLIRDITVDETSTLAKGANVTLDLNGHVITGTDNTSKNFSVIENYGTLTIKDSVGTGKITLKATTNNGWNKYSAVISNNPGGKLTVESGLIEHLGGTAMAYGIDNRTNGKGTYAETTINGGTIKSAYIAIRQFLNGVEADNILTVNYGTIDGANCSIYFQDPSANANSGKLVVESTAVLTKRVYLDVTEGSTEWPVTVSIADAAFASDVTERVVAYGVPAGYEVKATDGIWGVTYAAFKFVKYTITVSGEIGYNVYIRPSAKLFADSNAYVEFTTVDVDGNKVVRAKYLLSEGAYSKDDNAYRFTVGMMSYEMTTDIITTVYNGEGVPFEKTFTSNIQTYAEYMLTHSTDAKLVTLLKAMVNYGAQSQLYFGVATDKLANSILVETDRILDTALGKTYTNWQSAVVEDVANDGIDVINATIMLESTNAIRIYLNIDESIDVSTLTVTGATENKVHVHSVNGRYYVEVDNIYAYDIDTYFTVTVTDGTATVSVTYSVLNYIKSTINKNGAATDVVMALNIYSQAANAYFNK